MSGQRFTIAGVVDRMVAVFSGQGWLMLGLAILFGGLPRLVAEALTLSALKGVGLGGTAVAVNAQPLALFSTAGYWLALLVGWVGGAMASASMTTVAVAAIERRAISFGDSLGIAVMRLLPLLLLSILWTLAISVGLLLLIVPGVMLLVAWTVAWPAVIIEKEGAIAALERSAFLTRGARWPIFAIMLIAGFAALAVGGATGASSMALRSEDVGGVPVALLIVSAVISTLTTMVTATLIAAIYTELKAWKEGAGGGGGELGEIFA
jgi:hypothetical protein